MKIPTIFKSVSVPNVFKSLTQLEIALLVIFIIYIVLPIQTPNFLAGSVDSPLGMLVIFMVTVYLFFNVNPIVAVIYVFVAYELIRRSSNKPGRVNMVNYTPSQTKKDSDMKVMNPPKTSSLEEEVVEKMAPIGHSDISVYANSSFKPVAENVGSASVY
jgi:predicted membrane protein